MSPASPIAGSILTAPVAYTSVTSLPIKYLAMSKSCIVMSKKIPPETLMYSIGGGLGSLEVIFKMCTSPILPAFMISWALLKLGSNLLLKPICNLTFAFSTVSRASCILFRSKSIGFSQNMCLPAFAASIMNLEWVSVDEHISTASIS